MYEDLDKLVPIKKRLRIYTGSSNPSLAADIARILGVEVEGLVLEQFANGEIYARFDESVRGCDVFFVQSIVGQNVNDLLMETLIVADAAKRASARSITAVLPHYAYARQDRKAAPREPITARLVANLLETAGVDRVITLDLHQGQIEGFFDCPVNHLTALPLFGEYYKQKDFDWDETVVVSPDVGRAKAAKKTCIINDDMIDTAGTLCGAIRELKNMGAGDIYVCATHGIFSGKAIERIEEAPIAECVVTDAVPHTPEELGPKIGTISVASEIAECIYHVFTETSVSGMVGGRFTL